MRHGFVLKLLGGKTDQVALVVSPEVLAVGHGLWAVTEDALLGNGRCLWDSVDCSPGKAMVGL